MCQTCGCQDGENGGMTEQDYFNIGTDQTDFWEEEKEYITTLIPDED